MNDDDPKNRSQQLARDVLTLQFKLFIEALRDLALSPVTLVAAAIDLLLAKQQTPRYFYEVLRLGKRSEDWIDLWSAAEHEKGAAQEGLDSVLARVEEVVRDPATGARRAKVLKRWAERQLSRARRQAELALKNDQHG
jgi:hypothetical protein